MMEVQGRTREIDGKCYWVHKSGARIGPFESLVAAYADLLAFEYEQMTLWEKFWLAIVSLCMNVRENWR